MGFKSLENERVLLSLLDLKQLEELLPVASEPGLIKYSPSEIHTQELLKSYAEIAIEGYYRGDTIPLVIYDKQLQDYAGSTRFGYMDPVNKVLQIGWTWIGKKFQGSGLNTNVKLLMLEYAFETLEFEKVEFRIDERNTRSRKAVEKIGAQLEGILRRDVILSDGFRRNTCCYGILRQEWPDIKIELNRRIRK